MTITSLVRAYRGLAAIAAIGLCCSCASLPVSSTQGCADADQRLRETLSYLSAIEVLPEGCAAAAWSRDCDRRRDDLRRLSAKCPTHTPALLANAWLSYDDREFRRALEYLDTIFSLRSVEPDAAALRARMALDDGNVPFALRFTAEQLTLSPEHAGLHEARAAALFAAGRLPEARSELSIAAKLGAPGWRVAYNRGLIAEGEHRGKEAAAFYEEALQAWPGWAAPAARLKGLLAAD